MLQDTAGRPISAMIVVRDNEDIELASELRLKLTEAYRIEVVDVVYSAADCLRRMEQRPPDVMLIVEGLHDMPALDLSRQVNVIRGGATATILLVESGHLTTDYYDRAAASGARRVATLPPSRDRLIAAITEAVNIRPMEGRAPGAGRVRSADQLSVTIASAKGGVGKTFLAANLAAYLATTHPTKKVALVDLNLQFSALGPLMNLHPLRSIYDLLAVIGDLKPTDIDSIIVKHPVSAGNTLYVLPAPLNPREADEVLGEHISTLVTNLQRHYDMAIVDTTSTVSDVSIAGIGSSDQIFLICTPDVLAVAQTRALLEYLSNEGGVSREKMRLVINQARKGAEIQPEAIKEQFEIPVAAVIPYEPRVHRYVNSGVLLTQRSQELPAVDSVTKEIAKWGNQLIPLPEAAKAAQRQRRSASQAPAKRASSRRAPAKSRGR